MQSTDTETGCPWRKSHCESLVEKAQDEPRHSVVPERKRYSNTEGEGVK